MLTRSSRSSLPAVAASLALLTACASAQEPPGGPPDYAPPVLVSVRPDSATVLDRPPDEVVFQFNEVISEGGGQLGQFVVVSPRPREVDVDWKRSALAVKLAGGWRSGVVYHVTVLPGVTDLRNNRLEAGRTIVFSVGRPIPSTVVSGIVLDWEVGRTARRALVEAVLQPDSLVYAGLSDSLGSFILAALPAGPYVLYGTIDGNNNGTRDAGEAFDSVAVTLDSTLQHVFWAFRHDSAGPAIRNLARADSFTIRVEFNQPLAPRPVDSAAVTVFALPDTTPVAVAAVWTQATYDSVRGVELERARVADSARAAADTAGAPPDSVPTAVPPARGPAGPPAPEPQEPSPADTLLAQRPPLSSVLFVRVGVPLAPGARFLVAARAFNVLDVFAEPRSVLVVPGGPSP